MSLSSLSLITICLAIHLTSSLNATQQTLISINQCQFVIRMPKDKFTFLYCHTTDTNANQSIWEECIDQCCYGISGSNYPYPDYDVLTLCLQHSHPKYAKDNDLMIIGVSVAGGLIFVGLIIITCRIASLLCDNRVSHADSNQDQDGINGFTIGEASGILWRKCQESGYISVDLICSICLEGNPFVQLACRHVFHSQCIGAWFGKSQSCPNCNSRQQQKTIKCYCENCHQVYFIIRKKVLIRRRASLRKMRCESCQQLDALEDVRASTSWRCDYGNNRMEKSTENVLAGT